MKNKAQFKKKVKTVAIITLCWVLFISISYTNEYYFTLDLINLGKLSGNYEFWPDFFAMMILAIIGGIIGGYFLVFRMSSRYKRKSFAFGIINSGLLFLSIYIGTAVFGIFFMNFVYHSFETDFISAIQVSWENLWYNNLASPSFVVNMALFGVLVSGTQFMLQVSDKFGPGVLWKLITGKYYHPREEERIFMFLDLKSSTTIAEKIGNKQFFELLKDIYNDITEPIIYHLGEIYQYVGDEVVVTWQLNKGLKDHNCLACFFSIDQFIREKKDYYLENYEMIPSLKAGLHIGKATVGEIGVIKKDIVYSGDVLNTTSRIQGECNRQNVNILVSEELLQYLHLNGEYRSTPIGEILLRGKEGKVRLNTVELV